MIDNDTPHFEFSRTSDNPRQNLTYAFEFLIKQCQSHDLLRLVLAFRFLERKQPMIYRALLGQTLLNDIINYVKDEHDLRQCAKEDLDEY